MHVAEALTFRQKADRHQRRMQADRRERNRRYWRKLKEDPERFARRKEAQAKYKKLARLRKMKTERK